MGKLRLERLGYGFTKNGRSAPAMTPTAA